MTWEEFKKKVKELPNKTWCLTHHVGVHFNKGNVLWFEKDKKSKIDIYSVHEDKYETVRVKIQGNRTIQQAYNILENLL